MLRDYLIKQVKLLEELKGCHKVVVTKNSPVPYKEQNKNRIKEIERELVGLVRECYFGDFKEEDDDGIK